jgi:hypothetical protein
VLGVNPLQHLLAASRVLSTLPAAARQTIIGREFFPDLISGPVHQGLVVVFAVATGLSVLAGFASLLRAGRSIPAATGTPPADNPRADKPHADKPHADTPRAPKSQDRPRAR